jgi:hypothetical protein
MLIIATAAMQNQPTQILQQLGFETHSVVDPYTAMAELLAPRSRYRGTVISLQSVYREEIAMIGAIKRRLPQLEIWLSHTDNRQAALAEAMRLGADGLLGEEGLHRIAGSQSPGEYDATPTAQPALTSEPALNVTIPAPESEETQSDEAEDDQSHVNEPVLTADELRALLQEQPTMPPSGGHEN